MKILVINWQCIKNPSGGGAEVHLHEIFKRLARKGHDITLYCSLYDGAAENEVIDGINVIRHGSRNLFNFTVKKMYKDRFSKEKYDIIIDDINKIPFYTPRYVKEPLLAISHHFFGKSIFLETNPIFALYVYLSEQLVDYVYKKTPFAVVSQSTLDEFISRGFNPNLFAIVPNAIDPKDFPMTVGKKYSYPVVTYFGRLKKYKSVDHLFKAFHMIHENIPDARLHIIGKGDFQDRLLELADELNIKHKVKFFGFVDEDTKKNELTLSHCVVNTSMKEGWGITNIESNACGTPVISANVPGLKDSVSDGESGLLYEYANIKELADKIQQVLTSEELRDNLSIGAVNWAKKFSWDESSELMEQKISEILNN